MSESGNRGEECRHLMGNTLTCCVKPSASPKLSRRSEPAEPDYESEIYEAAAGDAVAVAPTPAALDPAELDFGTGEGHHLQHISDREMPEGKEAAGDGRSRQYLWPSPSPGSPGREPPPRAPSCPELAFPGLGTGEEGWLCRASPPLILSLSRPASFFASSLTNAQFFPLSPFLNPA